jgi:hypothetical protein
MILNNHHADFFERYNKKIIEQFAIRTISQSFNQSYGSYTSPDDTNNFDGISLDGSHALEITLVVTKNNMDGYVYEKLFAQGKRNLRTKHIKHHKLKATGELLQWQGGPVGEIITQIPTAIAIKNEKAQKRLLQNKCSSVDLCICIDDGGWLDVSSFDGLEANWPPNIFENIFFITSKLFLRYAKETGFEVRPKII